MKRVAMLMLLALLMNVTEARAQAGLYGESPGSPEEACAAYSGASSGDAYRCCMNSITQVCSSYVLLAASCKRIPVVQVRMECDETLDQNWRRNCKPCLERQCGIVK